MKHQSSGIITAMRTAQMPTATRKTPPTAAAMTECAKAVRDLMDAADWFNVDRGTLDDWLRTKPELARCFRRAKLADVREMRLIFREKAVAGSITAAEKYLKLSYPDAFQDRPPTLNVITEVRVLPPASREPLVIEGQLSSA